MALPGDRISAFGVRSAGTASGRSAVRRRMSFGAEHSRDMFSAGLNIPAERTRLKLPGDLPLEDWCRLGAKILAVSDSSAWWIGDWLIFGQEHYEDRYRRAMRETNLDYQTLRNYAWVARKFAPSRRRDSLTFQHHMEVAGLPENEQEHWLDFAVRLKWSKNELRKQIKASSSVEGDAGTACEVRLSLLLDQARLERWKAAAERSNQSLTEWIASIVDEAVWSAALLRAASRRLRKVSDGETSHCRDCGDRPNGHLHQLSLCGGRRELRWRRTGPGVKDPEPAARPGPRCAAGCPGRRRRPLLPEASGRQGG